MSLFPISSSNPYRHHHRRGSDASSVKRSGPNASSPKIKPENRFAPLFRLIKDPTAVLSSAFVLDEATKRHQLASARLKNVCSPAGTFRGGASLLTRS